MLKPTLQLKLGQTLTMTPQLQQAIRLLQLPVLDLERPDSGSARRKRHAGNGGLAGRPQDLGGHHC